MRNKKKKNNNYSDILLTTVKAIKDVIIKEERNMKMLECAYPDKEDDNEFAIMQQQIDEKDKRIQELEEERQIVGMPVKNKRDGRIGIVLHQWKNGSIAVLENINPRVINTHESWNTLEIITDEVKQVQTNSDSIPKQKIKKREFARELLQESEDK